MNSVPQSYNHKQNLSRPSGPYRTVITALWVAPYVPEIVAFPFKKELAVTVKVAVLEPAGMVTLEGAVAMKVLLLDSVTLAPPVGALPLMVTVPVEVFPRLMDVGFNVRDVNDGVVTLSVAVRELPL